MCAVSNVFFYVSHHNIDRLHCCRTIYVLAGQKVLDIPQKVSDTTPFCSFFLERKQYTLLRL